MFKVNGSRKLDWVLWKKLSKIELSLSMSENSWCSLIDLRSFYKARCLVSGDIVLNETLDLGIL